MLGPPHRPAVDRLDVDQADLAQPLEVEAHGVGVDAEALGEIRGRQRGGRAGQLLVHRVAGLVAQGLEDRELPFRIAPVHELDGTFRGAYFQDVACIYQHDANSRPRRPGRSGPRARPGTPAVARRRPRHAGRGDRPRAARQHRRPGHGGRRPGRPRRRRGGEGRAHHRRVPAPGPDPPGRRVQGARPSRGHRGDGRVRRDDPRAEVGGDAARPVQRSRGGGADGGAVDHAGAGGGERQGWRGQVVGDGEPRRRARGARADRRRARCRHLGLQRPPHARGRGSPRRQRRQDRSERRLGAGHERWARRHAQGRVDGVSGRRREHRLDVARLDPHQGAGAVPHRRALGRHGLPAHRHAARHR